MNPSRRLAILLALAAAALGSRAPAATLPATPVLGHPAEYVIVTPAAFAAEFQRLADWKTRLGTPALVKTLESIQAEYPAGRDDAERVRMFLQDAGAQWGTRWALLGGEPPFVPARAAHTTFYGGFDFVTDLYFGALAGDWDGDGDGVFGELDDAPDLGAEIAVGRAPVRSPAEAADFVDRSIAVELPPQVTSHRALLSAEVLFPELWSGGPVDWDGAVLAEQAAAFIAPVAGVTLERHYENTAGWSGSLPLSRTGLLAALEAGSGFFIPVHRANAVALEVVEETITILDLAALDPPDRGMRALLIGSGSGNFEGECLASTLVRGIGTACLAASDVVFSSPSTSVVTEFVKHLYPPHARPLGEAHDAVRAFLMPYGGFDGPLRVTLLEFNLLGDPEARVRVPSAAALAATHPTAVPAAGPGFVVDVTDGGAPVEGARVAAWLDGVALAIAATDAAGRAQLDFAPGTTGTATLTVTAADGERYESDLPVYAAMDVPPDAAGRPRFAAPAPNPASAAVRLAGVSPAAATLDLFDVGGRKVRRFALAPGRFDLRWDLRDEGGHAAPAGLYFARLGSAAGAITRRILVAR